MRSYVYLHDFYFFLANMFQHSWPKCSLNCFTFATPGFQVLLLAQYQCYTNISFKSECKSLLWPFQKRIGRKRIRPSVYDYMRCNASWDRSWVSEVEKEYEPTVEFIAVEVFHVLHTIYEVLQCEIGIDFTISRLISNNISTKATS